VIDRTRCRVQPGPTLWLDAAGAATGSPYRDPSLRSLLVQEVGVILPLRQLTVTYRPSSSGRGKLGGTVTATETYEEVADPGNQARRQTEEPHANRRVLDQDIRDHEDHDPEPPGQFNIPQSPHMR
jgi:hypothetical protein